jgi:uncharacterized membrane protein YhfC
MTLLMIAYVLNVLLMIALGVGLGVVLTHRFNLPWRFYWIGAATFVLSQVGHIPFNALVLPWLKNLGMPFPPTSAGIVAVAIFAGLSSGLFEETARWVMYRWAVKDARSWRKALVLGAGHGGIEAIIFGALAGWAVFQAIALLGVNDLSTVVSADQLPQVQAFLDAFRSASLFDTLLGALERSLALPLHLALSVLVLQCFTRQQGRWWLFAVLWHGSANGVTYCILQWTKNAYVAELSLAAFALFSLLIIWKLRQDEPPDAPENLAEPQPVLPIVIQPVGETTENLENTKYG